MENTYVKVTIIERYASGVRVYSLKGHIKVLDSSMIKINGEIIPMKNVAKIEKVRAKV